MTRRFNVWVSRFAIVGLGLVGAGRAGALAAEPPEASVSAKAVPSAAEATATPLTAERAAAKALQLRAKAEWYRSLGGAGYKSAFLRWAEAEAAHFEAEAARLTGPSIVRTPEAAEAWALVEYYRNMGGAAYKAGLVQRAEEEARRLEPGVPTVPAAETALGRHLRFGKAVEEFLVRAR
jgi:hypothetical protein